MEKDTLFKEMNNILKELDGKELDHIASMIAELKIRKYCVGAREKRELANLLCDTDPISVKFDYVRETRKSDPFAKGTIDVIGVKNPRDIPEVGSDFWKTGSVFSYYSAGDCKKLTKKIRPLIVFVHGEDADLRYGDTFRIGDVEFEVKGDYCALASCSIGSSKWSSKGRVEYKESTVKTVIDKWFAILRTKSSRGQQN